MIDRLKLSHTNPEQAKAIRSAIEGGNLSRAIQIHKALFPSGPVPLIRELDEGDLRECLETPMALFSFCTETELRELRIRMAVSWCAGSDLLRDESFRWPHSMSLKAVAHNFYMATAFRHTEQVQPWGIDRSVPSRQIVLLDVQLYRSLI